MFFPPWVQLSYMGMRASVSGYDLGQGGESLGTQARGNTDPISNEHLQNFGRELRGGGGLSSYPHPWLVSEFWEFLAVSIGLGLTGVSSSAISWLCRLTRFRFRYGSPVDRVETSIRVQLRLPKAQLRRVGSSKPKTASMWRTSSHIRRGSDARHSH
jgi:hypothetical protein